MIPGDIMKDPGDIIFTKGREKIVLAGANTGDRPARVGSRWHFAGANSAHGTRLDIAAGTAVRFAPRQTRQVVFIPMAGARRAIGFNGAVMGGL